MHFDLAIISLKLRVSRCSPGARYSVDPTPRPPDPPSSALTLRPARPVSRSDGADSHNRLQPPSVTAGIHTSLGVGTASRLPTGRTPARRRPLALARSRSVSATVARQLVRRAASTCWRRCRPRTTCRRTQSRPVQRPPAPSRSPPAEARLVRKNKAFKLQMSR